MIPSIKIPASKISKKSDLRRINTANVAIQQSTLRPFSYDPFKVSRLILGVKGNKRFKSQFRAFMGFVISTALQGEQFNYRNRETIAKAMSKELGYEVDVSVITKCTQAARDMGLEVTQYVHLSSNISMLNSIFYKLPFARRVFQLLRAFRNLPERIKSSIRSACVQNATLSKYCKRKKSPQRGKYDSDFWRELCGGMSMQEHAALLWYKKESLQEITAEEAQKSFEELDRIFSGNC
jgi:hypothetical protein